MKLAEENRYAKSVSGSKRRSARTQVVSKPTTITLSGLYWMIDFIFEFQEYGLKVV